MSTETTTFGSLPEGAVFSFPLVEARKWVKKGENGSPITPQTSTIYLPHPETEVTHYPNRP